MQQLTILELHILSQALSKAPSKPYMAYVPQLQKKLDVALALADAQRKATTDI